MTAFSTPFYFEPVPPIIRRTQLQVPLSRQLDVLVEMVAALGTLTNEGQRQTMSRIVGILRDHISRSRGMGRHNHEVLLSLIDRLRRESEHSWPDVESFQSAAGNVIVLLKSASA